MHKVNKTYSMALTISINQNTVILALVYMCSLYDWSPRAEFLPGIHYNLKGIKFERYDQLSSEFIKYIK